MKAMTRRFLAVLLALIMCSGSASAIVFDPSNAQEGKILALQTLVNNCMWTASDDSTYNTLTRWEDEILIHVSGNATAEDTDALNELIMQLGFRVPLMPAIGLVYDREEADILLYYVPSSEINALVPNITGESDIAFWHEQTDSVFHDGIIAISTDLSQTERNYGLLWCMVQILGANNAGCAFADSVLYSEWSDVQELSEIDWLILNMIYSPWVEPGMDASEVYERIYSQVF